MYDKGLLSKRTTVEVLGEIDLDVEVKRRKSETEEKLDDVMYPPVIQNVEQWPNDPGKVDQDVDDNDDVIPEDKKGQQKKDYANASVSNFYKTNKSLPASVKVLQSGAQTVWRKTFNSIVNVYLTFC